MPPYPCKRPEQSKYTGEKREVYGCMWGVRGLRHGGRTPLDESASIRLANDDE